jgi:RNA polymerase sigma-70 factor (ECF subfamily)
MIGRCFGKFLSQAGRLATIPNMRNADDRKRSEFEALVIEHHVRVRSFVRSLGVDPDWVDDLAQEAFLMAYRDWDSFDESRDFGRWIRGIAANLVRNEIRKDGRRRRILHTELTELLLGQSPEPVDRPEPLAVDAVRACLEKLDPTSRQVVLGRYRDGESATRLADRLETSAENIRQMLVRIRRRIKRCVELRARVEGGLT